VISTSIYSSITMVELTLSNNSWIFFYIHCSI